MPLSGEALQRPTYAFLHTLTEGRAAVCQLCYHDIFKCQVVQKTISMLGVPDGIAREPELLRQLAHDHIVEVWEAQWDPDPAWAGLEAITFVTPYHEGKSIYAALDEGHEFGVAAALTVTKDVLSALHYLHVEAGYVHRDVKPANLMLDAPRGRGFLGDLGSAAKIDPATGGAAGELGSPLYLAPEARPTGQVTPRSDLYSLGLCLVEMLNGRFPYESLDFDAMEVRLGQGQRALPDRRLELAPWVPKPLATFTRSMCATDPARRPRSAEAALVALGNLRVVDWHRHAGIGLVGTWDGRWPPEQRSARARQYEVTIDRVDRGQHAGRLHATARWRAPGGHWRNYARLEDWLADSAAEVGRFFRAVEAAAQSAPTR